MDPSPAGCAWLKAAPWARFVMRAARLGSAALLRSCHSIDLASHSQPHYLYLISTRPFWGLCRFPHTPCRDARRQRSRERSPWPGWDHGDVCPPPLSLCSAPHHFGALHMVLTGWQWDFPGSSRISLLHKSTASRAPALSFVSPPAIQGVHGGAAAYLGAVSR